MTLHKIQTQIKKILVLLALVFFCFTAAQQPFSPIDLGPNGTEINLQDYFPYLQNQEYQILQKPSELKIIPSNGHTLKVEGNMKNRIGILRLQYQEKVYDLVLKRSNRIPFTFTFESQKEYPDLKIKGSFNSWNINANPLTYQEGVYTFSADLIPGKYEYVFVSEGKEFPDPTNPKQVGNGIGGINSILIVGEEQPQRPTIFSHSFDDEIVRWSFTQKDLQFVALWNNQQLETSKLSGHKGHHEMLSETYIPAEAKKVERSYLRIFGYNQNQIANDILIPLAYGKPITDATKINRKDMHGNVMYSVMVDRFYNADVTNDRPLKRDDILPLNDWQGGDLKGLNQKIKEGYFEDLGVNNLWILPIVQNPEGPYGHMTEYGIDTKFTGYHGYWPISSSQIDNRFGTAEDFDKTIDLAHSQDMNILVDYVANHVHQEHPVIQQNPDWKTEYDLPDGRKNNRLYDEYRLTTWFDDFMPTLELRNPEVAEAMTDSALYWFKRFDIDGFRHDATKHIPNSFWRKLTHKLKTQIALPQNRTFYQIGETYGGHELIASYVNSGMLDAQFEFNLYHHLTHALFDEEYSMLNLETALQESTQYYGSHHLMGNISGNHDKGRIMSYADGSLSFTESAKEAGYTREIEVKDDIGYQKVAQLMAFNLFVPGIPVIYYGDEIGMPGGDDPDNRRMMEFENLAPKQLELKNTIKKLIHLRRNRMETMYGETEVLYVDDDFMVIMRNYLGQVSLLLLNKANEPKDMNLNLDVLPHAHHYEAHFGNEVKIDHHTLKTKIEAKSFEWVTLE